MRRPFSLALVVVLLLAAASACAAAGRAPRPREANALERRAEFDLNCPFETLTWVKIDAHTWGARGCGRQAVYVRPAMSLTGPWVLNSEIRNDPASTNPAAPPDATAAPAAAAPSVGATPAARQ